MYSNYELFQRSREGYFGVYFPSCETTREINTKLTLEWAQKQLVTRVHTLLYFYLFLTRQNKSINDDENDDLNPSSQWPDDCDAITWIVISNSLDIAFIHGDIHGRSCKKFSFVLDVSLRRGPGSVFMFKHDVTNITLKMCTYETRETRDCRPQSSSLPLRWPGIRRFCLFDYW